MARAGGGLGCALWIATSVAALDLPSGLEPELHEVLVERIGAEDWVRFRYVLPEIATLDHGQVAEDMEPLCAEVALPYIAQYGLAADKIVISLSDRVVDFGSSDPEATQFFETFDVVDGACMLEVFD